MRSGLQFVNCMCLHLAAHQIKHLDFHNARFGNGIFDFRRRIKWVWIILVH